MSKEIITSLQNPKIKNIQHLQKARERKKQGVFPVEGIREIEKAITKGYSFRQVFFCKEIIAEQTIDDLFKNTHCVIYEVDKAVYEKIAYRENAQGVIALIEPKDHNLSDLSLPKQPLILLLEGVEKPGNLGAILRTADAAGIDAVIVCDPQTDVYNPNVVRSSLGCVFTVPLAITDSETAINWLTEKNIAIYCTYLQAAKPYYEVDMKKGSAIVMGTESTGITDIWVNVATQNIIIPMQGEADSMNVSTACAVVVFEAKRQRWCG